MAKRGYQLKKRAKEMEETRRRITEAAVELHGTVGPARTSVSAIAERAGVQRHTVYRHFPTEVELFGACSAHYFAANPLPDPGAWSSIEDPGRRLARGLDDLYSYYERTEHMFSNVMRDLELVDALAGTLVAFGAYLRNAVGILAAGRRGGGPLLAAALSHALDFSTWRSLTTSQGLTRDEAIALMSALVDGAGAAQEARASAA